MSKIVDSHLAPPRARRGAGRRRQRNARATRLPVGRRASGLTSSLSCWSYLVVLSAVSVLSVLSVLGVPVVLSEVAGRARWACASLSVRGEGPRGGADAVVVKDLGGAWLSTSSTQRGVRRAA